METGNNHSNLDIEYKSDKFNPKSTEKYHLSVEILNTSILYTLFCTEELKYIYFKRVSYNSQNTDELIKYLNKEYLLKKEYSTSTISYSSDTLTLIPNEYYLDNQKEKVLGFIEDNTGDIKSEDIHQIDAKIIYSINKKLQNIIKEIQPQIIEKHTTNILIDQLIRQYNTLEEKSAFLFVQDSSIQIIVLNRDKLLFQNTFPIDSEIDILYYTLLSYEQLKLDPENTKLYLYGNTKKGDKIYSVLYDYIRYVNIGNLSNQLLFSNKLNKIDDHKYFALFNQILCV